jgi:thioredoxin-like negative regulator of GroEL
MAATRRSQSIEVISHGMQVDINQHLAFGNVTVVDFYADWCGPSRRLSPSLEQMASSDSEVVLRKIDIVNWRTAVVQQFNIHSIPQVNVYDRSGPSRRYCTRRRFRKSEKLRRASEGR